MHRHATFPYFTLRLSRARQLSGRRSGAGDRGNTGLFEVGEALGFHSAWVRQRHLERGVSSAATFLAAASQRTKRIGLGTAVIQLGYENPFRLAEDLATVDVLSRGRLNVGVSVVRRLSHISSRTM